jgi:hypothetical protein
MVGVDGGWFGCDQFRMLTPRKKLVCLTEWATPARAGPARDLAMLSVPMMLMVLMTHPV